MRPIFAIAAMLLLMQGSEQNQSEGDASPAKKITVGGVVLDSKRQPIPGVDVSLYVAGKERSIASVKTDLAKGHYHFVVEVGDTFDLVFTHSRYDLTIVTRLADGHPQSISKVLYRKGEERPASAAHEYMTSLDRFLFLAYSLEKEKRSTLIAYCGEQIAAAKEERLPTYQRNPDLKELDAFMQARWATVQEAVKQLR